MRSGYTVSNVSEPSVTPTRTFAPAWTLPSSSSRDSSLPTSRWMVRRSGLAPNSGSYPASADVLGVRLPLGVLQQQLGDLPQLLVY